MTILILSSPDDGHAAAVAWGLEQMGCAAHITPSLSECAGILSTIHLSDDPSIPGLVVLGSPQVRSVWNRRPRLCQAPVGCHPDDRKFVGNEWETFQRGLHYVQGFESAFWVNSDKDAIRAENKVLQLETARSVGLALPETIISNNPDHVRQFISRHQRVACKAFGGTHWEDADGVTRTTAVTILDPLSDLDDDSIRMCPTIYQSLIEKTDDVRVTIIGDRMFAVRYRRQTSKSEQLDVRVYGAGDGQLEFEVIELPPEVEKKIRQLMQRLGLVFGALDFALGPAGQFTFFEVNQGGQWLFIEYQCPSLPLLASFCALLSEGRSDYRNIDDRITFARFEQEPEYARIMTTRFAGNLPPWADEPSGIGNQFVINA